MRRPSRPLEAVAALVAAPALAVTALPAAGAAPPAAATPRSGVSAPVVGTGLGFTPTWHPNGRHHAAKPWRRGWPRPALFAPTSSGPLSGRRVLLDPGHDLGNSSHTRQIAASSWPHLRKGCNTTGTATNAGYPEATYAFRVVARLRRLLVAQGATVIVTRDRNTRASWGPCVQARGELGRQVGADLLLSVHADGGPSSGHGFHVIAPAYARGWTDDIARPSLRLAHKVVAGMVAAGQDRSTYLGRTVQVRSDQETLRNSDVPAVIVETLNMRNAGDARIASTRTGRDQVARGLYKGIRRYLRRSG